LENTISTGNKGKGIRSDCHVTLSLKSEGGIKLTLNSKVKVMYGKSIIRLAEEILAFYGIKHAEILIEDTGALPFVLAARIEAAIRQLIPTELEFLPAMLPQNTYSTKKDRHRFSRLYLP